MYKLSGSSGTPLGFPHYLGFRGPFKALVDFQEIQHRRQKPFRIIDMYGVACVRNDDGLREAAAFPHFIIEEGVALGTPFSREK